MKTLIFIILIIATSFSLLFFNDKGNEIIAPYLSSYLSDKTARNIEIQELKVDMGHIEATALIDEINQLKTDGEFSLSTKMVDLNYRLLSKNFPLKEFNLQGDIDVNGTEKGSIENMKIDGSGDAFKFDVAYDFILNKQKIYDLKLNIDKAEVERLLTIIKEPSYAKGRADILIQTPVVEKKISKGTMDIKLYETLLDEKILNKRFKTNIPPNTQLTAEGRYNLKDKRLHSIYQIKTKEPKSNYPLAIDGDMEYHNKKLIIDGNSSSLGGEINFTLIDNNLKAELKDVSVTKLMTMLNYYKIFKGRLFGDINYNIKDKIGDINTQLKQAQLLPNKFTEIVKMVRGINLAKERYNDSRFVAKINRQNIDFDFHAKSKTTDILLHKAHLNQNRKTIDAKYTLVIDNRDISGTIKGDIHNPNITIDASKFIKKEISNTMERFGIGEDEKKMLNETMEDIGIGKEEKDMIKGIFKGFF